MRNIYDDLREIGIDEGLLKHKALAKLVPTAYWPDNQESYYFGVDRNEGAIKIRRIKDDGNPIEIRKYGTGFSINFKGYMAFIRLGLDGSLEVSEERYTDSEIFDTTKRIFNEGGIELFREKVIKSKANSSLNIVSERIKREPNGYVAKVLLRKFDDEKNPSVSNMTETIGYYPLDLRYSTLVCSGGNSFSSWSELPSRISAADLDEYGLDSDLREFLNNCFSQLGDEEEKRWVNEYIEPIETTKYVNAQKVEDTATSYSLN